MIKHIMGFLYLCMIIPLTFTSNLKDEVQDYINQESENMKKLCKGTINSYTWQLPIEGSKKLYFIPEKEHDDSFWLLESVNDIKVFQPEEEGDPNILFNTKSNVKQNELVLEKLYPSYPKVTGVDILQFIITLGYVCNLNIGIFDMSDLSVPYQILFGKRYYNAMIKGYTETEFSTDNFIDKELFLNCAMKEIYNEQNFYIFQTKKDKILNSCIKNNILLENCPIGYDWLGKLLHENIFPNCVNWKLPLNSSFFSSNRVTFEIFSEDVNRILSKKIPKPRNSYKKIKNCTQIIPKSYEFIQNEHLIPYFEIAFDFSYEMVELVTEKITAFHIFKIFIPHVFDTLNFLWKYSFA